AGAGGLAGGGLGGGAFGGGGSGGANPVAGGPGAAGGSGAAAGSGWDTGGAGVGGGLGGPSGAAGGLPSSPLAGGGGYGGALGGYGGGGAYGGYGGGFETGYAGGGAGMRRDAIGIVADEANNSLVISATRNQYDKILRILGRLDAMPTQVLLETVIAEVTLNDNLAFGVQWFLKQQGSRFNLASADTSKASATSGTAGLITSAIRGVPGFNYLLAGSDFNVVLNALQGVTRVNVISSPNITVLDNRTAKLQVGDQVPIIKQSGQSALTAGAPILNQIEMKDTGVILSVTPRVNKNGLVVLDINQEVSDVVPTTTSAIDSPTIRQRRVATSVAVSDGHSLAIGGMVQEKAQITNENLPVLSELPVIGPAFRNRIDQRVRTELLVFIRPRVIRGTVEADRIAEDFRQQFRTMMPVRPVLPPPPLPAAYEGQQGILRRMLD
ncbi:general secretion pathway protein GspD, partial [Methylobacterium indicum]